MERCVCIQCGAEHSVSYFNRDRSRDNGRDPRCKDCTRHACKRSYRRHHGKHIAMKRRWKNENREINRLITRQWQLENPDAGKEATRRYRERLKRATPPWVDTEAIKLVYDECPRGYHVDHIFPLSHVDFCGLHVPDNLQILTAMDNFRKGNRAPVTGGGYL